MLRQALCPVQSDDTFEDVIGQPMSVFAAEHLAAFEEFRKRNWPNVDPEEFVGIALRFFMSFDPEEHASELLNHFRGSPKRENFSVRIR